jgi:hypothetical protein
MRGTRWIKVDATIVECFRAWREQPTNPHPSYEIVADIKAPAGEVERVSSQQKLRTVAHHWRPPNPGDVVHARWTRASRVALGSGRRSSLRREADQSAWEDPLRCARASWGRRGPDLEPR